MRRVRAVRWVQRILCLVLVGSGLACSSIPREKPTLAYAPADFRRALTTRVPEITASLSEAPFAIDEATIERARRFVMSAPRGPERVQALVDFLGEAKPEGLGLIYDWNATGNAKATLATGRGNCVALASVLVGLGRGLEWPIFYAEARTRRPDTKEFDEVYALSDHMAVLIVARSVQMIVDFAGSLDEVYTVRPIDDLTAYAHIINNVAAQSVMRTDEATDDRSWQEAIVGFDLATRIQPELGRAWNNMGIALTRLDRFDEARVAYERAVRLDTEFGSAEKNLRVMETRAEGKPQLLKTPLPGR